MRLNNTLIHLENGFEKVFDFVQASIVCLDENAIIQYANTAAEQLFDKKYKDIIGKHICDVINCSESFINIGKCSCGALCADCKLRLLIINVIENEQVIRDLELERKLLLEGRKVDSRLKVSAAPAVLNSGRVALLSINIIENKKEELEIAYTRDYCFNLKKEFEDIAIEFSFKCRNGKYRIVEATAKNLLKNKFISGILVSFKDITARKRKEEEVLFLYQHDALTGLYNRRYFDIKVKQMDDMGEMPLSIICGDINGLKMINETYGNPQGDRLITKTAELLKKCLGDGSIIARIGGGDFRMILPNTNHVEANELMKRIEHSFNDVAKSALFKTSFSLGCATKTNKDEPIDKITQLAEEHMHKDKLLHKESMRNSLIMSLKSTLFEKSKETEAHAERLVRLSKAIGQVLHLNDDKMNDLELLSVLHDIGKIGVKDSILEKKERLTEEERNQIMQHSIIGYRIAKSIPILQPISEYILHHHERYDGQGYPHKIKGEEIPLLSRIISIIDSYDAMTSDRAYRKAMTKEAAIEEIRKNSGLQFDPVIVEEFINFIKNSEL
jgi:diguanylate cyclase (GGDEF)-like protein